MSCWKLWLLILLARTRSAPQVKVRRHGIAAGRCTSASHGPAVTSCCLFLLLSLTHCTQPVAAAGAVQHALVRIVAEPGDRYMQGLAAVLLAGLDGAGVQLLQHPAAVAAVLARLAAHLPSRTEEAVLLSGLRQAAEEGEACWALLSMLAGALSREATAPPLSHEAAAVGAAPSQLAACTAEVLDLLNDNLRVLCADWSGSSSAARLQSHQAYVLNRLVRVLGGDDQQVMLQAALQRCQRPG